MSAFDDEFGLFGDDETVDEDERRSTLGARTVNTGETIIDDIEPEDERPARRRPGVEGGGEPRNGRRRPGERPPPRREVRREKLDPAVAQARASELLLFLAKKLVSKPDSVKVVQIEGERGPVIELEVDPDDLGKVIGRGGRVAQALRTLVRAGAEGRVSVDIVDSDETDFDENGDETEAQASGESAPADE
jgi:predicted RNA-binding protein YlqC (UPF0109 family)